MKITEASKLQMQILIPASLPQASLKEWYQPFKVVIEEEYHA